MVLINILTVALGMVALFIGGEWLVRSAARLASSFGVSAAVIGLTIVAWATSSPELVVTLQAAANNATELVVGNVIGSNVVNIGLTLGLMGLLFRVSIDRDLIRRDVPVMVISALALFILALDGVISQFDGLFLIGGFIVLSRYVYKRSQRQRAAMRQEMEEEGLVATPEKINQRLEVGKLIIGIVLLVVGANATVDGAIGLGRALGISELFIGLTVVAIGTSLPEVTASIVAGYRNHPQLAFSNLIGSNISNVLGIVGIAALVRPIPISPAILSFELPVMFGLSVLVMIFCWDHHLTRREATALIVIYAVFVGVSLFR
jgi:cation:H+ antiporter